MKSSKLHYHYVSVKVQHRLQQQPVVPQVNSIVINIGTFKTHLICLFLGTTSQTTSKIVFLSI